jgi:LmbE family N-acetylglucosaminyl deacetylase
MMTLLPAAEGRSLRLLCFGAHADDIEIGAGGTILALIDAGYALDVVWCVASAAGLRGEEAMRSARIWLDGARASRVVLAEFRDGYFPYAGGALKSWVEGVRRETEPDLVLTHQRHDAHQDHRELCNLTWNAFRDHTILEYEIPKWDGDLDRPNVYMALSRRLLERKIEVLTECFATQRSKDWFDAETFRGLARLRGMECRAPERYAEAFYGRKMLLAPR